MNNSCPIVHIGIVSIVSHLPTPMEGAIAGDMKNIVATAPTEAIAAIALGGKGAIVVEGA